MKRVFAFYVADGGYDAVVLENALKEALASGRVYDTARTRPSGMKFAVTATTISDATLCLISNYNGNSPPSRDSSKLVLLANHHKTNMLGYKHLHAKKLTNEMLLWEA